MRNARQLACLIKWAISAAPAGGTISFTVTSTAIPPTGTDAPDLFTFQILDSSDVAISTTAPNDNNTFAELQIDTELIVDRATHPGKEHGDVPRARAADIVNEVGVQGRHFRATHAPSLTTRRFDQTCRFVAVRIAKTGTCVRERDGLRALTAHQA